MTPYPGETNIDLDTVIHSQRAENCRNRHTPEASPDCPGFKPGKRSSGDVLQIYCDNCGLVVLHTTPERAKRDPAEDRSQNP